MSGFEPRSAADVTALIAGHPLAWVISRDFQATPLPLLAETDEQGNVVALLGHFARRNPHVATLTKDPAALVLFQGAQGYISPKLVSNPTWAPTWNYAVARFETEIEFVPHENDLALDLLVAHMEGEDGWSIREMGARYNTLVPHIIAFRAHVRSASATFKLGQDEKPATFSEIVAGLGNRALADAMVQHYDGAGI